MRGERRQFGLALRNQTTLNSHKNHKNNHKKKFNVYKEQCFSIKNRMKKGTHELSGFLALGRVVWFLIALGRIVWFLSSRQSCLIP